VLCCDRHLCLEGSLDGEDRSWGFGERNIGCGGEEVVVRGVEGFEGREGGRSELWNVGGRSNLNGLKSRAGTSTSTSSSSGSPGSSFITSISSSSSTESCSSSTTAESSSASGSAVGSERGVSEVSVSVGLIHGAVLESFKRWTESVPFSTLGRGFVGS